MPGAARLGRLVPVARGQVEACGDLAESLAQLPHLLTHAEHLLFERGEALRGQDAMGHEHAHEDGADDREDGDHHEADDEHEERTDRIEPTGHDSDLDRDEDGDDQEPKEDPAGQSHRSVPRAGITWWKSSGRVIRISCLSFSRGKVETMTVRFCESLSWWTVTLYSK